MSTRVERVVYVICPVTTNNKGEENLLLSRSQVSHKQRPIREISEPSKTLHAPSTCRHLSILADTMADQSPSKLSPTAGMFMPGAVQIPHTDENGELEFTRPEFMSQNHEISSVRGNYEDFHGANVVDYHGRDSYSDNYFVGDSQYDNGPYGTSYYPEYSNGGGSMFGDNGSNNYGSKGQGGDYKKTKGGYKNKKKDFKNKPQHNNHSATYYPGGEQSATYYPEGEQHAQYYTGGEQPYYVSEPTPYPCEQKRKALAEGMTAICVGCGAFGKKLQHGINGHNWASLSDTVDYSNFMSAPICPHGSAPKKHGGDRQTGKK